MPARRAAAEAEAEAGGGRLGGAKRAKKSVSDRSEDEKRCAAAPSGTDIVAADGLPKNTCMPDKLEFARPVEGCVRITAWNITSLKSSEPKGLFRYLDAEDADIVVLSETKVNDVPQHPKLSAYAHQYWGIGKTKGYAGVAMLSKLKPENVIYGLPTLKDADSRGRMITLEFGHTFVIGTYAVNAGEGLKSMQNKMAWNHAFARFITECDAKKPVIWCGDLNVVIDDRDLASASKKWNKSPGYTQIECDAHHALLNASAVPNSRPLVDVWRAKHPDAIGHFSFYGWRGMCRSKGIGWRLDTFILSKRIEDRAKQCEIRHDCYGASDHVPVYCDFVGPL